MNPPSFSEPTTIRKLTPPDLAEASRILRGLNPETPTEVISERLATLLSDHPHYHLFGAFVGDVLAGVCGGWVATKIWCGRYLEIDNLVVDPKHRSLGLGSQLILHLEAFGKAMECTVITLDSYAANRSSHRLYHRLGFEIWSFHFVKPLGDWKGNGDFAAS
jgi:ribosomal protein S18 acetylase RimI-like enzyme